MPTIDLTADELAAVATALRRAIEDGTGFLGRPRFDPLRGAHEARGGPKRPASLALAAGLVGRQARFRNHVVGFRRIGGDRRLSWTGTSACRFGPFCRRGAQF